jgi:hypothetical protein
MQFAIMAWTSDDSMVSSVFGVIDRKNPGKLPMISSKGHWAEFRTIDEGRFKFAEEAKKAIAAYGYYLIGVSVTVTEAFGTSN